MKTHLKVKIKYLAEESRIIRQEKERWLKKSRRARAKYGDAYGGGWMWNSLHEHRRGVVRSEARISLIAYGFLRGRTYEQIEGNAKTEPDWRRVRDCVRAFNKREVTDKTGSVYLPEDEIEARLQAWMPKKKKKPAPTIETVEQAINF